MTTVPAPEIVNTRSTNNRARVSREAAPPRQHVVERRPEIVESLVRSSPRRGPPRHLQRGALEPLADLLLREIERLVVDEIPLRQRDDTALDAEHVQDREVLLGLPAPALVRGDDEQDETDGPDAGQHVRDEPLVSGDVDEADLAPGGELAPGVAEVDREAAPLLFLPAVRIHPGEAHDQRRLAVVDVAGRGHDAELGHLLVESSSRRCRRRSSSPWTS